MDLRGRTLAAVDGGMSRRAAAGRFGVSVSSVIRWDATRRAAGGYAPKPQGGDMRSRRIDAQRAVVMAALEEERDQSLEELRARLAGRGVAASISALFGAAGVLIGQALGGVIFAGVAAVMVRRMMDGEAGAAAPEERFDRQARLMSLMHRRR